MQDKADLVVNGMTTYDPESFTYTRMEAVSNYDFGVQSLVGSLSVLCSNGSSSICESSPSTARMRMPSRLKSGLQSRSTCWLPSSGSVLGWISRFTKLYRF